MSDGILNDFLEEAGARMQKSVESTRAEFSTVRTGRASPHLLDRIEVDYYGTSTPLRQLAQVSASEARLLTITPYDKNSIKQIEKSILESDVGLTPSNDGQLIRLQIPDLTEERRRELVKVVHGIAEQGRVGVRNIRRDVMHDLRELKSEGEVGSATSRSSPTATAAGRASAGCRCSPATRREPTRSRRACATLRSSAYAS
jgi:ribosome recycling factor